MEPVHFYSPARKFILRVQGQNLARIAAGSGLRSEKQKGSTDRQVESRRKDNTTDTPHEAHLHTNQPTKEHSMQVNPPNDPSFQYSMTFATAPDTDTAIAALDLLREAGFWVEYTIHNILLWRWNE